VTWSVLSNCTRDIVSTVLIVHVTRSVLF